MVDLSLKNIFQWAFALSPFPSYLPQYFAMMEQLKSDTEPTDNGYSNSVSIDRGTDSFVRKRQSIGYSNMANSPGSSGFLVPGTPSKSQVEMKGGDEAGMSPATIFILLAAHLMRMLYFHGLILEEQSQLDHHSKRGLIHHIFHKRALAGDELDPDTRTDNMNMLSLKPTATSNMISSLAEFPPIQWDLFGQSCSMIIVQVMLLHAMMRLRRKRHSRHKKKPNCDFGDSDAPHIPQLSPSNGHSNGAQQILYTLTPQPFLQRQFEKMIRGVKSHILHLISPSNILRHHTFLQYMELVCLSSMAVKLMFDYHWYPRYRMVIVEGLKHTSIVLESCLALPQAMKNHAGGTTEGLSLVMVLGWVSGDFFKLCYFLLGSISASDGAQTVEHGGNNVFALGCLLALMVDLVVVMQMVCWYPTADVLHLREKLSQSIRHWRANKDDDAGKSLLINSQSKGRFASAVHLFYAVFRRKPMSTSISSQSLDS
ncbi:hypothetical protein ACHAWO_006823 [Cyclotella atomus]|jgi:hypothetical protein|uniref:Uncharacterized protein n=1 Tax=Cyclotella atomus TaxID=382360 RepID=A0ABD3PAC4_9STRA